MHYWSVLATGLLVGGASCAVVQGGLLAGAVARRDGTSGRSHDRATGSGTASARAHTVDDVRPVGAFLVGKLASHTLLGALLGGVGSAAQIGFRTRAFMQIGAGVLMVAMAANLLGARGLRRLVPSPPATLARLVRRSARAEAAFAPALLGFATVLIPCGITLSVMVLAVASGSVVTGAVGMAVFVLGTSPLFAMLGYFLRRSAGWMRGYLGKAAAIAVAVAGLVSINSGLVLAGSSVTGTAWSSLTGSAAQARADAAENTWGFVIPATGVETTLPEPGDTVVDLGRPSPRRLTYTCSMGMYRGVIEIS